LPYRYLEAKCGFVVLGSLLSPAHGMTVRERYRTNHGEILPSTHRLAIAQLLVESSKWLSIDPWEITRRRPMDYMSLLQHVSEVLDAQFPDIEIKVLYLAKANAVPKMSPVDLRKNGFGVVSVCRATEFDMMRRTLGAKWNGLIQCVEDTAVLDASMDIVTSRKVRENMRKGRSIEALAGTAIDLYVRNHDLGKKMTGEEEYNDEEKAMPDIPSRPARVYLRSQLLSMTSSTVAGETPGSLGYTPSWSSPGNPNNNPNSNNVSSSQAGAMQPKQRIHSSIPEVPDAAPTGGMTPGSPGSRASPVTVNRMGAGAEDVDSDPASSSSIMPKLMVASTSSLTIETTHLM
jgi:nicotinic acid mononucleotide adenylyltransferase